MKEAVLASKIPNVGNWDQMIGRLDQKAEESDQTANILWIIEKAREFQKNINFCFTDYAKAFDCVDHNKLENS